MSTPNPLTRLEREAKEYAALFKYGREYRQPAYSDGAIAQMNRAAPVVKALEDRLKEWESGYQAECAAIDRINKGRRKPSFWAGEDYKMNYPPIPHWVTEAKQILQTYKAEA